MDSGQWVPTRPSPPKLKVPRALRAGSEIPPSESGKSALSRPRSLKSFPDSLCGPTQEASLAARRVHFNETAEVAILTEGKAPPFLTACGGGSSAFYRAKLSSQTSARTTHGFTSSVLIG